MILAGGLGTRMRPLTGHVSKSLLPIANRPFLEHQIALLARHGVDEAVLLTGYLPDEYSSFARRVARYGMRLEVSTEEDPLGTAGAVRSRYGDLDGTALVFNGDVLTDMDLTALLEVHRSKGAAVTIALSWVGDSGAYGVLPMDDDGRVKAFVQNPKGVSMPGDWINAGVYALEPRALADVPPDTEWSFEYRLFPDLLAAGEALYGYRSEAYWLDIGTPARYLQAHFDVLEGRARAEADGRLIVEDLALGDGTRVLAPTLLAHAPTGPGATIGPLATIGPGARIGAGARVERSVVHEGARIGERAVLRNTIVGREVEVPPDTELTDAVVA